MERWKKKNPSLRIGDSEEDAIVMGDDEEEVEALSSSGGSYQAPPLAECIGPVITGQRAVRSSPGYREAREQRRQEKSKVGEFEPVKGTHAARKRVSAALYEHLIETERQYKQTLPFLLSSQECLAAWLGSPEEDNEKENRDVGEGSSQGFLRLIPDRSLSPIPIPAPVNTGGKGEITQQVH